MKELLLRTLYHAGLPGMLRLGKKNTLSVLCLHRISDERDYFFNPIQTETFRLLLEYVCKYYIVVSFKDIHVPASKPKLILSFDDGYYDFIQHAMPILQRMGLPANHNIVNACANSNETIWTQKLNDIFNHLKENNITTDPEIKKVSEFGGNWMMYYLKFFHHLLNTGEQKRKNVITQLAAQYNIRSHHRMMNWEEIIYLANNDVDVGSHTYNHNILTTVEGMTAMETEVRASLDELRIKLNREVDILSLPNGQYNEQVKAFVEKSGVKYMLLVDNQVNDISQVNREFNLISRIYLMDDPIHETILRAERFHARMRK